jgi:hypothetical protein
MAAGHTKLKPQSSIMALNITFASWHIRDILLTLIDLSRRTRDRRPCPRPQFLKNDGDGRVSGAAFCTGINKLDLVKEEPGREEM